MQKPPEVNSPIASQPESHTISPELKTETPCCGADGEAFPRGGRMKNELFRRLEKECPEAIRGQVTAPDGMTVPILGTIGDGCPRTIHPHAEKIITGAHAEPSYNLTLSELIKVADALKAHERTADAHAVKTIITGKGIPEALTKVDQMTAEEKLEAIRGVLYGSYNICRSFVQIMLIADAGAADRVVEFFESRCGEPAGSL